MAQEINASYIVVARHAAGTVGDQRRLNDLISSAWKDVLSSPEQRAGIAAALGVPAEHLDPDKPPMEAKVGKSGLTGAEVLIVLAAAAKAFIAGASAAAGKTAFETVWRRYLSGRLQDPRTQALGPEQKSREVPDKV